MLLFQLEYSGQPYALFTMQHPVITSVNRYQKAVSWKQTFLGLRPMPQMFDDKTILNNMCCSVGSYPLRHACGCCSLESSFEIYQRTLSYVKLRTNLGQVSYH